MQVGGRCGISKTQLFFLVLFSLLPLVIGALESFFVFVCVSWFDEWKLETLKKTERNS